MDGRGTDRHTNGLVGARSIVTGGGSVGRFVFSLVWTGVWTEQDDGSGKRRSSHQINPPERIENRAGVLLSDQGSAAVDRFDRTKEGANPETPEHDGFGERSQRCVSSECTVRIETSLGPSAGRAAVSATLMPGV